MAGEQYIELALIALRDALSDGLSAQLATIEIEQSLGLNSIPRPAAVLAARAFSDNRSPLVCCFWDGATPNNARERFWAVDCTIAVQAVSPLGAGPNALEELEALHARYATAVVRLLRGNAGLAPSHQGRIVQALITDAEAFAGRGDDASTRAVTLFGVRVDVQGEV